MANEQRSFFASPAQQLAPTQQVAPSLQAVSSSIILSEPTKVDLDVYRGDSGRFRITVKDSVGAPIDITAATWDSDIRLNSTSPTVITNFDIIPVVGDPSSIDVVLTPENSALLTTNCVYDIEMAVTSTVTTLISGSIKVTQDVSRQDAGPT